MNHLSDDWFFSFSVQARGKALLNALNSLQQLDKALDRFLAWLSETESALELLEAEEEKYGPRDDFHRSHGCHDQIRVCISLILQQRISECFLFFRGTD